MTLAEKLAKARDYLIGRQRAYRLVFNPENQFTQVVLKDLARFCRATESTFDADPRLHAVKEGRREVFLRIAKHLDLDTKALLKLYGVNDD